MSPGAFSGPIGQSVKGLGSKWTICKFKVISNPNFLLLPEDVEADLNLDRFYAYEICLAIITGKLNNDFSAGMWKRKLEAEAVEAVAL